MNNEIIVLSLAAAGTGLIHTLLGPDHYLPFIVMARARKWSITKTIWLTVVCGIGHVGSSIILGLVGVAFGIGMQKIEIIDDVRGNIAAFAFIAFGLGYLIYGIFRARKNKIHKHFHMHQGEIHLHEHKHENEHNHVHNKNITPWILITIFVLGPCEPLIPLMILPAAQNSTLGMIAIPAAFSIMTVITMLTIVLLGIFGYNKLPFGKFEKHTHTIAGATILFSGLAIQFLGL